MNAGFQVTPQKLAEWAERQKTLQREIAERQDELADVSKQLEYATYLASRLAKPRAGVPAVSSEPPKVTVGTNGKTNGSGSVSINPATTNMTDAIVSIVNSSVSPVSKKELRKKLMEVGYSSGSLGPYLYTSINRLKKRGSIHVLPDGRASKALQ